MSTADIVEDCNLRPTDLSLRGGGFPPLYYSPPPHSFVLGARETMTSSSSDHNNNNNSSPELVRSSKPHCQRFKWNATASAVSGTCSARNTNNNSNNSAAGKGRGRGRKRGWKFHDLSDDTDAGLGRKKLCGAGDDRLENEVAQVYGERVHVKHVGADHVVLEPLVISDPDLIKFNTALRVVCDRKRSTYQLQVLPFTVEQGSLTGKGKLMEAVARMLGDHGQVVCPGVACAMLTPHAYLPAPAASPPPPPRTPSSGAALTPTDRLLMSLNDEIANSRRRRASPPPPYDNGGADHRCLLWHVPAAAKQHGAGMKLLPDAMKWCANCLRDSRQLQS